MIEPAFSLPSSIEAERKHLLSQRKKAYSLIFLMIMLAQTSYIGALEGWSLYTELEEIQQEPLRVDSPAVCAATSRSSGTAIHVDVTEGDDAYPGTTNCPKASLGAAVTLATSEAASNPEIVLHAGLYHENVSVNNLDNLLIRAADGDRVVFDGTRSITDDLGGVWGTADSDGIQEVTLTEDGWQLFLAYEEQVPARWPNAGFDDETVFNRSYWAEGTLTNSNNAYTKGWLTDAGPEAGVHTGLNETVNLSGLDPVGAIAVMNLGSFRSNSRIITDWNPNNGTFAYDGDGVGWKTKHHAYFLEGKRELIDQDGEWWYNNTNNRLHYKTPSGQDANNLDLRVKVQPFAISVDGSDGVTIQGIDFFGTTVNFNNCDGCSFTNATLEYPSTSKRGLGIAGESEEDRWMTRFYRSTNSFVDKISITNTDGGAIEFQGSAGQSHNNTVNNSYFHAIDWSAADQKGLMVTIYEGGRDMYFTNNTVHLTGASSVLSIGDAPKVFYNEVWDVGYLQTDGAVVQVMQAEAPGSEIAYNWIHDVIKYGARFDAPIGEAGEGRNGTMHHNVIWNAAGGLMVKGDYHNIHNNTVFNSSGKNDMIILTDNGVNNGNSTIHQNAADKMADHRSDSWSLYPLPAGTYWNNWNGYVNTTGSVWNQLVDPANGDFRPKTNSHLDNMSAGAYDAGVSNPWTAGISWTYSTPNAPVAGCMLDYADNYDADATLSDGSCLFSSYTPPSTLDLRLHLDPTNSSSYGGSGTNVADLSGYNNNGTVAASGPTWDSDFTRFTYDGACTGSSGSYVCDEIEIEDSTTLRPGEPYEDLAVELNQGSTTQYLKAPATSAGNTLGAVETSFTIQAWVKPTDCESPSGVPTIVSKAYSFKIGCDDGTWHYILGDGTDWNTVQWVDTGVSAKNNVWQHLALTRASSSTGVKLFLNGVESYSVSSYEGALANNNTEPLHVGSRSGTWLTSDAWHGLIDDLRIYTSDRSSTIADDMNEYPNVNDANLNAYFDFNLERHNDTVTSVPNMATGSGASSASLTSVTGSPKVVRTWDVSTSGSDTILTFERTVITAQGGWRVPTGVSSADALIVGGGGGGGYNTGGGGGGGGVGFYNSTALTAGSAVVVVVGQGGQGSTTNTADGANGTLSQLGTTVVGGGGGGATWTSSGADGVDAPTGSPAFIQNGSGGGASNANGVGGTGATDGGDGTNDAGGGGGGAGEDGSDAPSSNNGGDGGDGLNSNITGSSVMYGSGAGGGSWNSYGDGGAGAGNGGTTTAATHGTTNRGGGGGGGGGNSNDGANGGSGVVIVRFASVDHNDWSVATWINASSLQGSTIIGTYDDNGQSSDIGWALRIRAGNGNLYSTVGPSSNTSAAWTSDASIDTDRWYHVVMVVDVGNTLRLYLDGVNVANGSLSGSGNLRDVSNSVFLGSYNGGEEDQPFDGQIGSVMVFADALNASNIDQLYTSGKGVYSNTTNLSYAQSSSTMLLDQTYSFPLTVTNGEVTTSYSLTGTLLSGMNFESSNGTIWGTPTAAMTSTTYTVTANNSAGSYSTSISLTSQHVAPYDLVYAPENMTLEKGTAMTTNTPSVNGGTVTSWEISPSVPTGLSFSTSTGAISGTPTVLQTTAVSYTIWANNSGGSASAQVNITINDAAPVVSYSTTEITGTKNVAISPHVGPTSSGGAVTSWAISPSPGSAFHFNSANGYISGTPSVLLTRTQYTIWGNNSGGSSVAYVNVTINDAVPNSLGYTPENMTLEKGTTMTTNTPSVSGGTVTSWEISPSLPSGLAFSASTGAISGTPSVLQTTATTYTVWANNSGGSESAQVNITINDQIASITYSTPVEISNNRPLASTITPTTSGGAITSWEISPSLPTGLSFGTSNGSIWGTPENVTSNVTYTIYANNSGGSASTTLTLNMNWTLTPSVDGAYITRNSSIGTDITWEWDYDPLQADNLSIVTGEYNTCAIKDNGDVYCWGRNGNGQIGNGQTSQTNTACGNSGHKCKDVPTLTQVRGSNNYDAVSLAFGDRHACALLDDGDVVCWGRNNAGQLGTSGGDKDTPQSINLGTGRTATSIYAGGNYNCAILDDASVKCWGQNNEGQLGIGSQTNTNTPSTINSLGSGRTAVTLATAFNSVCALLDDGSVKCWGANHQGQLGNGGSGSRLTSPPSSAIDLGSGRTAKAITGGETHFCAILDDDSIKCWGGGGNGKLGTGSINGENAPASTSGSFASGRYAVAIDAGYQHTCVILDNGDLTCWGDDSKGQLGNGATVTGIKSSLQSTTADLGSGRTAISLSAGGQHTCALLDNGELKCWGNRGSGQVGDNGGFGSSVSDRTSPVNVNGGHTFLDTGAFPSAAVSGATCAVSPSLPTGLSLTSGTCAITGTPTVTATNATYTIWANISGQSFSGQIWLEVGLNAPIPSYSPTTYAFTKDSTISTVVPSNTGGEVTTWAINATLPSGLSFGTTNGSIWGTPDTITTATTYTIWANNSAGSGSTTITLAMNDVAPSITFTPSTLNLVTGSAMTSVSVSNSGGSIVSCSVSPSLPSGLSLSSTCVLSGTPTVASSAVSYTITATNTGGSDTATFSLTVQASGGSLTITPTNREGSVNSAIANITMSYTHQISNYGWTSGVSNTTSTITNNYLSGSGTHLLGVDSGEQGEMVIVYPHNDTSSSSGTHSLGMMYRWNGTWTETILDTATDTGHYPSVAIDRQGAIHIAYTDYSTNPDTLRYATNASGTWVFTTLGYAASNNGIGRGTAIVVHPITDAVHIVATSYENSVRGLQYYTNEDGSWTNETITDATKDEGYDPAMAMDADGNLYVAHYCNNGCSDLRLSSRISGAWQNETVASTLNIGKDPDIAIDSQGTIHIVSQYANNLRIYLHSGTPGSWTAQTTLSGGNAYWPVVGVDSNDAVHISYHYATTQKDVMYMTNASGSWSTASMIEGYGGWGSEMVIDANDDIFIPNVAPGISEIQLTTVKGSGQGLTVLPIYDISPMLPDGLTMNWRNGTISGTPTEAIANTTFTVTVTALGTTTQSTFTLYITGEPGTIAYNDIQAANQTVISTATPSFTNNSTSGTVTTWAISPSLPNGLSFGTTNGSIWGTPTVEQIKTSYTVWANNTAGSSSTTINITVGPAAPGPFEYEPENNTWTNNTEVYLAPQFINQTTGNGSTWQVADIDSGTSGSLDLTSVMHVLVGDVIYFGPDDGVNGIELWAYNTSNATSWLVEDIRQGSSSSNPGSNMMHVINGVLYFNAVATGGQELWKHDPSTGTTARVYDINPGSTGSGVGLRMSEVVGDVLYFSANDGSTGHELWAYNTSNSSNPWRVADINSGSDSSNPGIWLEILVGDTLYFSANDGSTGHELWAHNTSNGTTWQAAEIRSGFADSNPGYYMQLLVGDTLYFSAYDGSTGVELWAHDTSNHSTWQVANLYHGSASSNPGEFMQLLVGDTIYFSAMNGSTGVELWAHDTSNHSTWQAADLNSGSGSSGVGQYMGLLVGDTIYFDASDGSTGVELWAHDTSNHSTWQVADLNSGSGSSGLGQYMDLLVGDTIYFSAADGSTGVELWAHSTSNYSTWQVADLNSGSSGSKPGQHMEILIGDTLYFSAADGSTGTELWAHRPSSINYQTNTGGAVTTWAINASLPSGVSFGTNNGTIYGTPTELWTQTSYMVWANNSGGSSVAYLNITVVDEVPTISYSPENLTLTKGNQSSDLPLNATLTGSGAITSWAISPSLPTGLSFSTSTGAISGTPTVLQTIATTYTIWANNSGGSAFAQVNITINDEAPDISYSPDWFVLTNNTAMSSTTPTNSGGAIPSAVIASANNPGYQTSIAVDSYGYKHISWSGNSGYLKYATDASGSWVGQIVDTSSATGYYSSIAIDSNGGVHISYFDNSNDDLKYATCSSACTTASNWNNVSVDTSGDVGYNTSIAIDSNDGVHISYFDETNDDLKYATCSSSCTTASNWDKVSVDTTGHVGLFNSIAIDSNDGVHISYYDDTNYDLKYATCSSSCTTASNWDKVAIDTTGFVGSFTSIAIDSNDGVHVSYWAFTPGLKYASCSSSCTTASNWDKVGIDTEPGRHTSIAIDSNDGVHISYHDYTNHDLKYATCSSGCTTASNWNYETVHSIGQTGYYTSIAIDANDVIHISYYDDTNNKIKYLALDSSSNTLGYSISPDLPEGLTLDPISGEISGTPTELSTNTTYTITARNSGGVNTTTITILVNDQVPNALGYTPENMTLSKGTAMTTNTPSVSGGTVTSWEISPSLPSGLSFGTSNGTIWGIPTVLQTTATTYTIWANNSGGSASAQVNITINDQAPGPFEYNPENNTLTNNTYVHLEPDFINITTGNGSTWSTTPAGYQLTTSYSGDVPCLNQTYNGTIYVSYNAKLHGYGIANDTLWLINNTIESVGCDSWAMWPSGTGYAQSVSHSYGTSLYFTGKDGSDRNLYGYGMENGTIWVESTADPGVWSMLVDDVMYFIGETGNSGYELHGHNLSNGTTWMLDDIDSGSGSITGPELGHNWPVLVESTFVFGAVFSNGSTHNRETWAHNISNGTSWQLSTMDGTTFNAPVIGDVVYFTQTISSNQWLYAYNASNETFWQVSTDEFRYPFEIDGILYGYWEYGYYPYNSQLRAHNPSNGTTWFVSTPGLLDPLNMGGTLYYAGSLTGTSNVKLWAYEPTNSTGWKVSDLTIPYSYDRVFIALGDVIYFTASNATTSGLWAHSSSNHSTWFVSNPFSSISATAVAVVNGTLYLGNSGMAGHQPTSINYQTNTGGAVTSWAINASLPSGLSFSTTNGSIYGTPTELWTQTAYMVWANNSGGSSVAYLNITVVDELPTIAYSPADLTLTNNTASSDLPLVPTITGSGEITSWEINASLPSGLTFGTSNGTIWGTPTELWTQTAYMVWANNSGGSSVAYLNITVVDELPTIAYSPADLTLTNNTASSDLPLVPTITGSGEITSWEINASLPSGLTFGTSNGTIWGTPTELWTQTAYMVWANNSGGSSVAYLNITVVDELPTIAYSPADLTLTNNTASSDFPLAPTITGSGEITSWAINASLPSGLTFETSNGTIWGTPTELWTQTAYLVWANNSGGSAVAYLNITVVDELPTLSYSPENLTLIKNQTSTDLPLNATLTGSGTITSWAISPALPSGVSFGTSNGTIWGIATVLQTSPVTYTIWANNTGGSTSATVNITINDEAPSISYTPSELNLTRVTTSSDLPLTPINTGGYTQTTALCSSSGTPKLFVVSDHEGTRHVLCGTTLYSIDLDGTQTVSTNHVTGTGFGLEIDDDGHLHIGHWVYNYPHIEIHHTTNKNGSWQSSEVYNFTIGGSVGYDQQGFSMAVGSDDSIHFTYIRTTGAGNANNLYHLSNQSGSWSSALLTNTNKPTMPSLALNDDNVPHVAFSAGNSISVGKYENGSYTTLFSRSNYLDPDIAIDAQGDVHVVYRRGSYGLAYSTNASGSWQHTSLESKRHIDVRIALDSNDYPHVITASITGQYNNYRHVNYYSHDGSSWSGGNITPAIYSIQQPRPDIFIDDNDVISMVHHDQNNGNLFTRSGSTTYGYSISPALPSGLTFSQSTGTISGVSTVQMNRTMFTITANNSGGSSTAYINITVNDRMPSFTYNPENLTLTNNTVSSDLPLAPTVPHSTADAPTDWVLIGTLPAGLNFGTNNGTIWGTATELWATTNYTVYGNNTGGSFNVSINITVNDEVPTLSYLPENVTLTRGQSSSDLPLAPTLSGSGVITSWGINATLPNGLFFGPNNGTLYGIATVNMTTTAYTIYANNSGGSASAQINLTVLEPIVELDYNPENLTLVRSDAMTTLHPTVTGGNAETWGIHPPIPAGLNFADGVLSGTPTVNLSTTMFTIYANTTGGSATHTINITILEPIVTLDYNPENLTLVRSIAMTDLHPIVTGGSVETWEIHPSIPAGLNFAGGVLSGTPTVNMTLTMFTIYANTTGGSASHTINLTILEPGVILEYNPENQTLTRGVAMVTMTPTVTNGTTETWSIDPILPSGLNFNNGVISGTPTVNMTRTMFTVWANTTGGAAFHTINLTILEPIVGLDYNPENLTLTRGVAMTDLHPIVTGGNVSEWGISPIPLSGLTFAEGMLYGTPGANQTTPIMYTIYANTTGGSVTHTINITVLEPVVDLFYNPENQTFIRMEQSIVWSPTVSGGIPETWAVEPALPNGLVFDNGTISGSPTVNLTTTQYIVWANNSGGSASTSINITINEPAPEIEYVPSDLVLTRDTAMTTLQPNVTGGAIESWAIEPDIPNGLSFVDGVISGTPTVIQNQTQYVVWANNSGGSLMAYLNITILDIVPEISYMPENFTLTNDTTAIDVLPVNIGGPALTWSISPALSDGLEFNETTGHITGTPTEVMDVRTYVITATNTGGSATTQINITVLDQVPMVAYVPDDVTLLNNSTVLTMEAISTGGIVTAWSIMPNPSPGLLFDATNGTLSGVATQVQNRTMYVITASNDVGSINVVVNITIEDLFYNMSLGPLYLLNNSEMIALEPELTINGSTFEIEPDLPEGLFLGTENGTIWGTPTELMDLTNFTIYANSSLFNDAFVVQIGVLEDTDLDGLPNELPGDADPRRGLIEDLDDDGDGFTDLIEGDCLSDPLDGSDVPSDLDGDFVCNAIDDDIDGDGLNNSVETNTSTYVDSNNTGTDPWDADTDGDGICDGPIAPALPVDHCEAGPDAFPNDAAAYLDTDGDGMPDELWGESTTGLIEDLDDDNDGWTDLDEADCGPTDSKNELDTPVDSDGDGICDFNEVLSVTYGTGDFELLQGQRNVTLQPIITGMTVDIWEISPALPYGLLFGGDTMARTSNGNGTVYGVPLIASNLTEYTVTATNLLTGTQISTTFNLSIAEDYDLDGLPNNNTRLGLFEADFDDDGDGFNDTFELECGGDPYNRSSVPKIESDGTCYAFRSYEQPPEKDKNPFKPICFPIIFLLLAFILIVPLILTRRKERVGVQAEHVTATPAILSGSGTITDPFVLRAAKIPYNSKIKTEERIRCAEMSPGYEVKVRETNIEINKRRFGATQFGGVQDGTGVLKSNNDGLLMIQFTFDGTIEPSEFGMVYKSELILDEKTYFVWHVETKAKKGK